LQRGHDHVKDRVALHPGLAEGEEGQGGCPYPLRS
jgi:hypothetical protein